MSESEAASDSEGSEAGVEDEGPIYRYDKLYHSAQDKKDIMAMPEIQREQLLSERAQEVDRHNQDLALRRLLASREKEEARKAKKNKRKASAASLDDGNRKSSRQKTTLGGRKVGEASEAIMAYKKQREQRGKRGEVRRKEPTTKDNKSRSRVSSDDAEGDSEVEWDDRGRSPSPPKDDPPAELRDIQRARVGRTNFAQVCFYPGFEETMLGCYVRLNVGPNPSGVNEYRLCSIAGKIVLIRRQKTIDFSRYQRRKEICTGGSQRSVILDRPICTPRPWQEHPLIPLRYVLRLSIHRGTWIRIYRLLANISRRNSTGTDKSWQSMTASWLQRRSLPKKSWTSTV